VPKRYYFHAAPPSARQAILTEGLRPGKSASYGPPAVYLFRFRDFAENYVSRPMDVWQVDVKGLRLWPDPEDPAAASYVDQPIVAKRLKFLGTYLDGELHDI